MKVNHYRHLGIIGASIVAGPSVGTVADVCPCPLNFASSR